MEKYRISKSDGSVVFGQLLGMCDHITFTLGNFPIVQIGKQSEPTFLFLWEY